MYPLSVPSEVYKGYVAIVVLALIAATLVCILIGFGMTNMPKNGAFRGACTGARLTDGLLSGCVGPIPRDPFHLDSIFPFRTIFR